VSTQVLAVLRNQLLQLIDGRSRARFVNQCELIDVEIGDVIIEIDQEVQYVYCPINCVITCEWEMIGSKQLLMALIGYEGVLCINQLLAIKPSPYRAVVRKSGQLWRITNHLFAAQMILTPALETILKHYLYVAYGDAVQTSACNLFHLLEQRLARLLLMYHDRSKTNEFMITHVLLAQMLGVRRVSVTKAAGALQAKNLVKYHRGHITIIDSIGLSQIACSCYQKDIDRYQNIMCTH
jgi:hypothetical protein